MDISWTRTTSHRLQDLRGNSSSEDSADEDNVEHSICEEAVKETVGDWYGDLDCETLPPNAELYIKHSVSRVFHHDTCENLQTALDKSLNECMTAVS